MSEFIQDLSEIIKSGKEARHHRQTPETQKRIAEEIQNLDENDTKSIFEIFKAKVEKNPSDFYVFIFDLVSYVGHENYKQLGTRLWVMTYNYLSDSSKEKLLLELIDTNTRYFWEAIRLMPGFCSEIDFPPDLAAGWFEGLCEKVKNDLASGGFYRGVGNYGYNFPKSAIKTVKLYCENLNDNNLVLASNLLGASRCRLSQEKTFQELDSELQRNLKLNHRLCHYRSFAHSFERGHSSIDDIIERLNIMLQGEAKEKEEAFRLAMSCSYSEKVTKNELSKLLDWIKKRLEYAETGEAKYFVTQFLVHLYRKENLRIINIQDTCWILRRIQPIPNNNKGTWDDIEHFLVERLREKYEVFETILTALVDSNPVGMIVFFEERTDYLVRELSGDNTKRLMTQYLFSSEETKRKLGRTLFTKCKIDGLDVKILENVSDKQIKVMLLDLIGHPVIEENKGSQLLIALETVINNKNNEIKELYKQELLTQAINYPGGCLEALKERVEDSPLFDEVVRVAEKYFSELKDIFNSPAISFTFSGYEKATNMAENKINKQIRDGVEDQSVFLKLVKKIAIVYGTTWSVRTGDKLGEATPLQEYSHAVELPRLELIDPEGMVIKRFQYSHLLEEQS